MQHVEGDIGLYRREHRGNVTTDVDAGDPVALPRQRLGTGPAGAQRHLALGRPATHQYGDVLAHAVLLTPSGPLIRAFPNRVENKRRVESFDAFKPGRAYRHRA